MALALAALLIVGLAGCGGDDDAATGQEGTDELTQITVGVLPSVNAAPLHLAIAEGFFADQGLEVEPQVAQGGSQLITALVTGATDFSHVGVIPAIIGRGNGLPIKIVASYLEAQTDESDEFQVIVVDEDSDIRDVSDLPGHTIAVNELRQFGEVQIRGSLEDQGIDPDSVDFTEIPFPDMNGALERGEVDAIWQIEPFLTQALDAGAVQVDAPAVVLGDGEHFPDGAWMTTEEYAEANPEIVDAFVRAVNRATEYAAENLDEVRAMIPTFTEVDPELAEEVRLPNFDPTLNEEGVEKSIELTVRYGVVETEPTLDDLLLR